MSILFDLLPLIIGFILIALACWVVGLILRLNWGNITTLAVLLIGLRTALLFVHRL